MLNKTLIDSTIVLGASLAAVNADCSRLKLFAKRIDYRAVIFVDLINQ